MSMNLDAIAIAAFGITRLDALEDGICIRCKRDISELDTFGVMDAREYIRSALCPHCFDEICDDMEGKDA